ncbi:hypothetical protein EDB89DRAFT_1903379 [Lactarius sanguifluus]|nr:hypothetical protein EDB89DRAFT_1903379 [Lactarius sanguifluus]
MVIVIVIVVIVIVIIVVVLEGVVVIVEWPHMVVCCHCCCCRPGIHQGGHGQAMCADRPVGSDTCNNTTTRNNKMATPWATQQRQGDTHQPRHQGAAHRLQHNVASIDHDDRVTQLRHNAVSIDHNDRATRQENDFN